MKFEILFIVYHLFLSQRKISTNIALSLCQYASVIVWSWNHVDYLNLCLL